MNHVSKGYIIPHVDRMIFLCPYLVFSRLEEFKYLGTTLTNQNYIQQKIKNSLKLVNDCYYSVKNLLSCGLLSKNVKIKIYRTIILPVVLYGSET